MIAAADLLGSRAAHQVPMELPQGSAGGSTETAFRMGDAVIHSEHGIGLLRGIETVGGNGMAAQETIRHRVRGRATLMVPVQEIGLLWRYGADPEAVSLDRLDGESWKKRRAEVGRQIAETAHGLIRLANERKARDAPKLGPPATGIRALRGRIPVRRDRRSGARRRGHPRRSEVGPPMHRLVCGDVGFGKTEVALRAAAAAVLSGWQVAVVVPTTVLARQHLGTFRRRFAPFGKQIARTIAPGDPRRGSHRQTGTGRWDDGYRDRHARHRRQGRPV